MLRPAPCERCAGEACTSDGACAIWWHAYKSGLLTGPARVEAAAACVRRGAARRSRFWRTRFWHGLAATSPILDSPEEPSASRIRGVSHGADRTSGSCDAMILGWPGAPEQAQYAADNGPPRSQRGLIPETSSRPEVSACSRWPAASRRGGVNARCPCDRGRPVFRRRSGRVSAALGASPGASL